MAQLDSLSAEVLRDATGAALERKRALSRERNRRYRERHPEKRKQKYYANREKILAQERERYLQPGFAKRRIAYVKEWVADNRETHRVYGKKWKEKNKERVIAKDARLRGKYPARYLLYIAKARSKKSGLPFDLTEAWANARWTGRCELTGIEFVKTTARAGPYAPSIDRINPKLGYIQGNCRFVLWALNRFKNCDTDDVMIHIAKALVNGTT